jgi:dihydroorotase
MEIPFTIWANPTCSTTQHSKSNQSQFLDAIAGTATTPHLMLTHSMTHALMPHRFRTPLTLAAHKGKARAAKALLAGKLRLFLLHESPMP